MTVATQSNFVTFLGDDIADTFPFTFPVYDEDHFVVYLQDTTTKNLVLLDPADYTVTGVGNENGGNIVTDDPVASDNRIILARILPLTQDLDVDNQGGFYPNNFERELDLIMMMLQQHNEELGRTVRGQVTEAWPQLNPPPDRAGKLLGFADDATAYPTTETEDILVGLLAAILVAGPGIAITIGSGIITISNTDPGGGALQECWLLEEAASGDGSAGEAEFIRDTIFTALVGVGCTITQDDPGDTITITVTGALDAEGVRDLVAAFFVAGNGIILTPDDPGNTFAVAVDPEYIRDTVDAFVVGGVGITATVDDAGNTLTLDIADDIQAVASAATVTPTFLNNSVHITAQAAGLTIANPTGTAVDGHGILIRIKDNGTARAITWGAKFRTFNDALPSTTVISKTTYVGVVYNLTDDKWDVLGVRQEA